MRPLRHPIRKLHPFGVRGEAFGRGLILGFALLAARGGWAQEPPSPERPAEPTPTTPRPGRFRVGPFYLTPTFRIGAIGLDTNVFYTSTDRRTDVTASGGPGLDIVLPFGHSVQLLTRGTLDYLYFVRTESQRRLNGGALARIQWDGNRTQASLEESFTPIFGRPGFEVDLRVHQTQERTAATLNRRLFGRISSRASVMRGHTEVREGEVFLGTDLGRTLTNDSRGGSLGLRYALTLKTSFLVEGERQTLLFPRDPSRDGVFTHVRAGVETASTTLISGRALAGVGWLRPRTGAAFEETQFGVAEVEAILHVSPRTRIGGRYRRSVGYSAFAPAGGAPTLRTQAVEALAEKEIWSNRLDLRLHGRITKFGTDAPVALELPGAGRLRELRDDTLREAGAEVAYRFRQRLRIGLVGTYTDRRSNISYFGIEGLLVGATASFTP